MDVRCSFILEPLRLLVKGTRAEKFPWNRLRVPLTAKTPCISNTSPRVKGLSLLRLLLTSDCCSDHSVLAAYSPAESFHYPLNSNVG